MPALDRLNTVDTTLLCTSSVIAVFSTFFRAQKKYYLALHNYVVYRLKRSLNIYTFSANAHLVKLVNTVDLKSALI